MSTINVRSYKGPVRPDGTPIELPQKVLKLTKKSNMRHKKPNRSRVGDFLVGLLLFLVACAMAFPLVFAISSSLKPLDELFRFPPTLFPRHPTIDNFSDLLVTMGQSWVPFSRYITNTVVITLVGTLGHLLIASLAAYVLAKYDFPLGKQFFALVVTALMFNGYVTAIPNYLTMTRLNLVDTHWAVILPAFAAPIGLFLMKQFMEGLPMSLIESAKIDGAKEFRIFWTIVMPNVKPAWLTLIIFSVQNLWNAKASAVIYSEAQKTLVYALQQIQAGGGSYGRRHGCADTDFHPQPEPDSRNDGDIRSERLREEDADEPHGFPSLRLSGCVLPLRRALQTELEDKLAEAILNGEVKRGDCIEAGTVKKEIRFIRKEDRL